MTWTTKDDIYWATPSHDYLSGLEIMDKLKQDKKNISLGRFYVNMGRLVEEGLVEFKEDQDEDGRFRRYRRKPNGKPIDESRESESPLALGLLPQLT